MITREQDGDRGIIGIIEEIDIYYIKEFLLINA